VLTRVLTRSFTKIFYSGPWLIGGWLLGSLLGNTSPKDGFVSFVVVCCVLLVFAYVVLDKPITEIEQLQREMIEKEKKKDKKDS